MPKVIKIYKAKRVLELWETNENGNTSKVVEFKIGLGFAPAGEKHREGDGRTPEGQYYICTKNPKSMFTLFMGLSYPSIKDAQYGLDEAYISQEDYDNVADAIGRGKRPPWETPLGGKIGIHGMGSGRDWTAGCMALDDEDIRTLWDLVDLETPVTIYA